MPEEERDKLDRKVCYCFHVTWRKVRNFIRIEKPRVPSQISQCNSAGTGCGWCIPFLKQIFEQEKVGERIELDQLSAEEYARQRAMYIREGKGTPAEGAEPLPDRERE